MSRENCAFLQFYYKVPYKRFWVAFTGSHYSCVKLYLKEKAKFTVWNQTQIGKTFTVHTMFCYTHHNVFFGWLFIWIGLKNSVWNFVQLWVFFSFLKESNFNEDRKIKKIVYKNVQKNRKGVIVSQVNLFLILLDVLKCFIANIWV